MIRLDEQAALAQPGARQQGEELRLPCPVHGSRGDSLCLSSNPVGKALWHCHAGCPSDDVRDALVIMGILVEDGTPRMVEPPGFDHERFLQGTIQITECREPIDYLVSRGLDTVNLLTRDLRFHRERQLLYAIVRAADGTVTGVHSTNVQTRQRRAHGKVKGSSVQLYVPHDGRLAIAEGIETAMSFQSITGIPTWSALSAVGMRSFEIPKGITQITAATDFDGAGLHAAEHLLRRVKRNGLQARIAVPGGNDWYRADFNDVLTRKSHERMGSDRASIHRP